MKPARWTVLFMVLCFLACAVSAAEPAQTVHCTGILLTAPALTDRFLSEAEIDHTDTTGGMTFHVGSLSGQPVVILESQGSEALLAAGTALMLSRYDVSGVLIAGYVQPFQAQSSPLDVVIATQLVSYDTGRITDSGMEWTGIAGYPADAALTNYAWDAVVAMIGENHVSRGIVTTGETDVASETVAQRLQSEFGAMAFGTQGAAAAEVCGRCGVPYAAVYTLTEAVQDTAEWTEPAADVLVKSLKGVLTQAVPATAGIPAEPAQDTAGTASSEGPAYTDVQYVMYLGTNDKDTNQPVFTQAEAVEQAKQILIRHFGGYTIQEASGGWLDEGELYQEYTLVIYLSDTTPEKVHAAADELVETFHQSSVLIQTNPTRTEFYSGNE